MLLDTFQCSWPGCYQEFTEPAPRWQLIEDALYNGWSVDEEQGLYYCPEHTTPTSEQLRDMGLVWVVGCHTCDFEEEYDSEEEAKNEYTGHECESDTWIWKPDEVIVHQERRAHSQMVYAEKRAAEDKVAKAGFERAMAEQDRIYQYAVRWLRIRNLFLFWKRTHIDGVSR